MTDLLVSVWMAVHVACLFVHTCVCGQLILYDLLNVVNVCMLLAVLSVIFI